MSDERTLLSGTALNVVGLGAGVLAAFGVQILIGRHLGREGLGLVTVAVQVAFVAAAGSRFGMDLSAVRDVAVLVDREQGGAQQLAAAGYQLHAAVTLSQLLDHWRTMGGIDEATYVRVRAYTTQTG
jgi:hypothetical protein